MFRRFRNGGSILGDAVLAVGAFVIAAATMLIAALNGWYPQDMASYLGCAALACAAWPASRLIPRTALLVVAAVVALPDWWFDVPEVRVTPLVVAAFGAVLRGAPMLFVAPVATLSAAAALAHVPLRQFLVDPPSIRYAALLLVDPSRRILVAVVLIVVVALGHAIRKQRAIAADLRTRNAELLALQEREHTRVAAEVRTAIARDIHDVVAHHMSALVVRAQAAARVGPDDPRRLRQTLGELATDGSNALTAMRRVVQIMRTDSAAPPQTASALDAEFVNIVGRVRASGRSVKVSGSVVVGTEFVRIALLRIAQEALTNVLLHSDARQVTVTFVSTGSVVGVTITDDGSPSPQVDAPLGGNGIVGMTERAHAAGGTLVAGPLPHGGWHVAASLPATGVPVKESA